MARPIFDHLEKRLQPLGRPTAAVERPTALARPITRGSRFLRRRVKRAVRRIGRTRRARWTAKDPRRPHGDKKQPIVGRIARLHGSMHFRKRRQSLHMRMVVAARLRRPPKIERQIRIRRNGERALRPSHVASLPR